MTTHPITRSEGLTNPKYRDDIDGLRAIAVLSVVAFHAFPAWIKGGFIGVDVFFVISGFLISTIIFESLEKDSFSFAGFYARRIRRIFPALVLVMLACYVFGWFVLFTDEYRTLGKHISAGALFISNFQLWKESGYFDASAETKIFLHLWSLGIEEQFYIVWPLLLWVAWKRKFNLLVITLVVAGASFYLNLRNVHKDAVATFYSPLTRFWELLCGSLLAWVTLYRKDVFASIKASLVAWSGQMSDVDTQAKARKIDGLLSLVGLALLLYGFWRIDKDVDFPGIWASVPVVGAVLLIAAGPEAWLNRRILSHRVAVWFGLISFPLYLWHWPLLAFARIIEGQEASRELRIAAVLLSIVLAWMTYKLIERPLRFGRNGGRSVIALLALMTGVGVAGTLAWNEHVLPYSNEQGLEKIVKAAGDWDYPSKKFRRVDFRDNAYFFMDGSASMPKTMYFGDSNVEQYGPRIEKIVSENPAAKSVFIAARGGCVPIRHVHGKGNPHCMAFTEQSIEFSKTQDVDEIVIGAVWFYYFSGEHYYDDGKRTLEIKSGSEGEALAYKELSDMISELIRAGKKVYLVSNIPMGPEIDPKNMVNRSLVPLGFKVTHESLDKSSLLERYGHISKRLREIASKNGAQFIDPLEYLCSGGKCPTVAMNGEPIYRDWCHIRPWYVRDYISYLDETMITSKPLDK